jgi:hypothetical protein
MYKDRFVVSVIYDGHPVKESGPRSNREVAIPFDSEYKLRLKNKNNRACTARIFIDNKKVSALGDLIINANGSMDLERFVDRSLHEGKRFKFVPLNHPDVDDPTCSENGIIRVEFRLAKHKNDVQLNWDFPGYPGWQPLPPFWDHGGYDYDNIYFKSSGGSLGSLRKVGASADNSTKSRSLSDSSSTNYFCSSDTGGVAPGATIEGSGSSQSFTYSTLEVEEVATILRLKIVGLKHKSNPTPRPPFKPVRDRFCSECGYKTKEGAKFCSQCGYRLL